MTDPTKLVIAEKIGVNPGTPGLGTVTSISGGLGITVTPNPITNTGTVALTPSGGAVLLQAATPGTQQTGNINVSGALIVGGAAHIVGKLTLDGVLDPPAIVVENKVHGDSATAPITFSATDTNSNKSSVSWGIELPGDGSSPGNLVARTGAGLARLRITGVEAFSIPDAADLLVAPNTFTFIGTAAPATDFADAFAVLNVQSTENDTAAIPALFQSAQSGSFDFVSVGMGCYLGTTHLLGSLQFQSTGTDDGTAYFNFHFGNAGGTGNEGPIKFAGKGASDEAGIIVNDTLALTPQAGIYARHATLPSALFQTSATDGSNGNPTVVARANTAQTAPLFQLQDAASANLFVINPNGQSFYAAGGLDLQTGVNPDGSFSGGGGNFSYGVNDGVVSTGGYFLGFNNGTHSWQSGTKEMDFDNTGLLTVPGNVDAASYSVGGTSLVSGCGTTTSCSNIAGGRTVFGSVALTTGTPSTATVTGISPAFASSSSYVCTVTNATSATGNLLKVVNVSGSSFTITGPTAVTDRINYICVGL